MEHNFTTKYSVEPNRTPQYKVGDLVMVSSNQHVLDKIKGTIIDVFPNQRNVFYNIETKTRKTTSIPERMLVLVE